MPKTHRRSSSLSSLTISDEQSSSQGSGSSNSEVLDGMSMEDPEQQSTSWLLEGDDSELGGSSEEDPVEEHQRVSGLLQGVVGACEKTAKPQEAFAAMEAAAGGLAGSGFAEELLGDALLTMVARLRSLQSYDMSRFDRKSRQGSSGRLQDTQHAKNFNKLMKVTGGKYDKREPNKGKRFLDHARALTFSIGTGYAFKAKKAKKSYDKSMELGEELKARATAEAEQIYAEVGAPVSSLLTTLSGDYDCKPAGKVKAFVMAVAKNLLADTSPQGRERRRKEAEQAEQDQGTDEDNEIVDEE